MADGENGNAAPRAIGQVVVTGLEGGRVNVGLSPERPLDIAERRLLYGALKFIEREIQATRLRAALNGPCVQLASGLPPHPRLDGG